MSYYYYLYLYFFGFHIAGGRKLLTAAINYEIRENCTKPGISHFPPIDLPGGKVGQLIIPFIISVYLCILLARICDGYFIASIRIICTSKSSYFNKSLI